MNKKLKDELTTLQSTLAERINKKQSSLNQLRLAKEQTDARIEELTPEEKIDVATFDASKFMNVTGELNTLRQYSKELSLKIGELENAPLGYVDDTYMSRLHALEREANEEFEEKLRKIAVDLASVIDENNTLIRELGVLGSNWAPSPWAYAYFSRTRSYNDSVEFMKCLDANNIKTSFNIYEWG